MGGQPKPSTTTSSTQGTTGPSPQAAPYFPPLYASGANAVASNQSTPTPTQSVAGANPTEMSAVSQLLNVAPSLGTNAGAFQDQAGKIASGWYSNPQNNPNFAGAVTSALTPIENQLRQVILPGLAGNSISNGGAGPGPTAYGGATLGLNNEKALQDWGITAGNTTGTMANSAFNAGLNLIPSAPSIANEGNVLATAPSAATGQAGTAQQGYAQQDINNKLAQYQLGLNAPWQGLQQFANLLTTGGYGQNTSNTQGTSTAAPANLWTQILQGLTGGAGIAQSLFASPSGGTSAASSIGSGLGNIWSGLGNMFAPAVAAI